MAKITQSYWPATHEIDLLNTTCGDVLRQAARLYPEQIALIDGHPEPELRKRWTYSELLAASESIAEILAGRFPTGTHIALLAANCPEWVILQFALALSGMVMVTVNPACRTNELAYVLRQSGARGIFYQACYRGVSISETISEAGKRERLSIELSVCLDELKDFADSSLQRSELPHISPVEPVMIQYTSGTTGSPKGVLLNHYSISNTARIMALLKGLDENTINLAVAPLFHTGGCVGGILSSLQTYGTILLPEGFDAEIVLNLIEQESVTYTFAVPTMLIALLEAQARNPRDISSLNVIFSGGSPVPIEVVRRVESHFGVNLIIGYGLTETSPAVTHTRLDDSSLDKSETIGRAIPHVEVKIVDPHSSQITAIDEPGELCCRGFNIMLGYYDMPEATAAAIDGDGWLHTGDLCAMDSRGYCRVTGRLKDMIIRGGENIYPREIEEILYTHPAVTEVAVIGIPDDYWGEQVAGVVTLKAGGKISSSELRQFVNANLASHKVPKFWYSLDEMPVTASGKLQKYQLVEMYREGKLQALEF